MYRSHVLVCAGAGCVSSGCQAVRDAMLQELKRAGLDGEVTVVETGCMGSCDLGPVVVTYPEGVFYQRVKPEDVVDIVEEHLRKGRPVERLLYKQAGTDEVVPTLDKISFFSEQQKVVLRNCGSIDPTKIEEYIAREGYQALAKVLTEMTPEQVIAEVKVSGLRGRGGAGFPTGTKWQFVHDAKGERKFVVCNADEGDPGAFMDRSVLEGDPHSVIEAMAIAAYAVGANQGYVYVRAEYPLAVARLGIALKQARESGLLGKNIMGTGFDFELEIRIGAGAFVCGEETALLASIMGKRGEPRPRPPFPAVSGLWGQPTLINNVETYANIAPIILRGGEWYAQFGVGQSRGTKVFALAGDINNTGLVEVPMGTPLGKIIYDIGGGIRGGKKFKAAQTGGPSGGCIPASHLNTPMDYESLKALGAIVGSGGLIVMDEDTCMVDLARFFLDFVQDESCGKCPPCRIGTKRMLEILERITRGQGREGDIELLEELGTQIQQSALCGLGQTAPNPVLSTIKYFREEYEAHIRDKKCPACVCRSMFSAPCTHTCPVGVDVPNYVAAIAEGNYGEAWGIVRERNPFPGICGRVCTHPCEDKCFRGQLDEPIAIASLKRFVADHVAQHGGGRQPVPAAPKGKQVAIVGGGPAGLTAAYRLALLGYCPTVFEALPVLGGMMAVGIPDYRLPKQTLNSEIEAIRALGVETKTNTALGRDFTIDSLFGDGYEAVFLATGAHKCMALGVPGEDMPGVVNGVAFLRETALGQTPKVGQRVAVVGGGDVAVDAARTALRLGAKEVTILYRRTREEMPAHPREIEEAEQEGVRIQYLVAPVRVVGNGRVSGIELQQMALAEFDSGGRRRPTAVEGSEHILKADTIICAIGQAPDLSGLNGDELATTRRGTLAVNRSLGTSRPGVFAGGDAVRGPATVIWAIADGEAAARAIDEYLCPPQPAATDEDEWEEPKAAAAVAEPLEEEEEEVQEKPRVAMPVVAAGKRRTCFMEVECGYTEAMALEEAGRCLRCNRTGEQAK